MFSKTNSQYERKNTYALVRSEAQLQFINDEKFKKCPYKSMIIHQNGHLTFFFYLTWCCKTDAFCRSTAEPSGTKNTQGRVKFIDFHAA